jgi:hypothetical protein
MNPFFFVNEVRRLLRVLVVTTAGARAADKELSIVGNLELDSGNGLAATVGTPPVLERCVESDGSSSLTHTESLVDDDVEGHEELRRDDRQGSSG